ncbi:MAG: TadE/TadG family type IV pilus assembly protein [Planctomycetaceae bacterium]
MHSARRLLRRTKLSRRAAAVVEVAIVLPIFFLIVMGIVEFGRAMMVGQLLTNGARLGARRAIVEGATNSQVESEVTDFLTQTLNVAASDLTITIEITPAPGNPDPANNLSAAGTKDLVRLNVTVPFDKVAYAAGNFLTGTNLQGQCAMRKE